MDASTTAPAHTRNITLNYGYTITVSGQVLGSSLAGGTLSLVNGVNVIIEVEGVEVKSGIASGVAKNCVVTVDHPAGLNITASMTGYTSTTVSVDSAVPGTGNTFTRLISLTPRRAE